jgi:hypothetical protein
MALVLKDRVQEITNTTGTGTLTLAGAVEGFQSFSAIGNGNTTYYVISGGSQWEVGVGTYTASGTTLSRDSVLASSNNGNLVDFAAGSKTVFVSYPTERIVIADGTTIQVANSATLPVSAGGTGAATLTANNVILGNTTSAVQFVAPGTAGNVLTSDGTTWASTAPGGGFTSGTLMLFQQTAAPTGWTKQTTHDNKALRVVSGTASSGGSVAFTTAFASGLNAGDTTLTTSQIPSHTHTAATRVFAIAFSETFGNYVAGSGNTGATGGGGSHNHTLPSFAVQYVDLIIASKN